MRKFVAALLIALTLTSGAYATKPTVQDRAWYRAMILAGVPEKEWKNWTRPVTKIVYTPRYIPISRSEGARLCGETMPVFEGPSPADLKLVFYVEVFVRPSEAKLLFDTLTHEYLHVVWVQRAIYDDDWHAANPNSEAWVVALLPSNCPPF